LTWSETGALPPGLSFSSDHFGGLLSLSGTPTATGTFPFTLMITDAAGQTSAPQDFNIVVAEHGFKVTGSMAAWRNFHHAALLQDGRVLVTGGTDPHGAALSSAELYDPSARTFTSAGTMVDARGCHTATSLQDGRVLIAGGFDGQTAVATAEIFDPAKGTFAATGNLAAARACQTATLLKDGRVLIAGGVDNNGPLASAELFNPANGSFSSAGPMGTARVYHTATLLTDGRVLVAGGADALSADLLNTFFNPISSGELFEPATGLFSATKSDMTVARFAHTGTLLSTGKVLIAGGSTNGNIAGEFALATAELFDPATGTFTATGSMSGTRTYHTATPLNDGTVLLAGGDPYNLLNLVPGIFIGSPPSPLNAAELFDPVSGTFTETGGLVTARENHTATLLNDGTVLVTGGFWNGQLAEETYQ
jgi:hypothetical protein